MNAVTAVALLLWLCAAAVSPALECLWGWPGLRAGLIATVLLQGLVAVVSLAAVWPPGTTAAVVVGVVAGGWLVEYAGVKTGFPFGRYAYTPRLQPQVGGVPVWVAVAYAGVIVPAWGVADLLVGGRRGPEFLIASALAGTASDLLLDPMLVSRRVWEWHTRGGYFGIPWQNFLGWLGVTAGLTLVFRPAPLEPLPLLLVYTAAWLMGVVALVGWRLPGPAVVGGVVMGLMAGGAWIQVLLSGERSRLLF